MKSHTPHFSDSLIQNAALAQFGLVYATYWYLGETISQKTKNDYAFADLLPAAILTVSAGVMLYPNMDRLSNAASAMFGAVKKGIQHVNAALGAPQVSADNTSLLRPRRS
ncbi:MAG TPA: hypothetical protein VLJ15_03725 [Gammaproteobacteria bacterium]|nr:hypothetical protein [Gammaproteobacteria bacterium]